MLLLVGACAETLPDRIALTPGGEPVEVVTEKPNPDLYVPLGEVTGVAQGADKETATTQAKNDLRNNASARGGTVVTVDSLDAKLEWQGRKTLVRLTGTAYKPKE